MQEQKPSKETEEKSPMFPGGLANFLKSMQERQQSPQDRNWRRNYRKRSGLGGRGYTKSLHSKVETRMRRKLAKTNQLKKVKKSRRKAKKKRQRAK
jgi:hypothetical protein